MPVVLPLEPAIRGRGCRLRLVPRSTRVVAGAALALAVVVVVATQSAMLYALGWQPPDDTQVVFICCECCSEVVPSDPEPPDLGEPEGIEGVLGPKTAAELATPDRFKPITDEQIADACAGLLRE